VVRPHPPPMRRSQRPRLRDWREPDPLEEPRAPCERLDREAVELPEVRDEPPVGVPLLSRAPVPLLPSPFPDLIDLLPFLVATNHLPHH
jgi:hypothetical protein